MKDELTKLRKTNFELANLTALLKVEVSSLKEKINSMEKQHDVQLELTEMRGNELLEAQAENDRLRVQMRQMCANKDNSEAQQMLFGVTLTKLEGENSHLKNQLTILREDNDKLNAQVTAMNQMYVQNLSKQEDLLRSRVAQPVTSTTYKSSTVITKVDLGEQKQPNH